MGSNRRPTFDMVHDTGAPQLSDRITPFPIARLLLAVRFILFPRFIE